MISEAFDNTDFELAREERKFDIKPCTFNAAVEQTLIHIAELIIKKQRDYGKGNILTFGEFGVLVRMNDKFERLKNLVLNKKDAENESIDDTLDDIIGYATLYKLLRNNQFELPLE